MGAKHELKKQLESDAKSQISIVLDAIKENADGSLSWDHHLAIDDHLSVTAGFLKRTWEDAILININGDDTWPKPKNGHTHLMTMK